MTLLSQNGTTVYIFPLHRITFTAETYQTPITDHDKSHSWMNIQTLGIGCAN